MRHKMREMCKGCPATEIAKRGNGSQYVECVIGGDSRDITSTLHPKCPIMSLLKRAAAESGITIIKDVETGSEYILYSAGGIEKLK